MNATTTVDPGMSTLLPGQTPDGNPILAVLLKRTLRANRVKAAAIVHGQDVTKPVRAYQLFVPRVFKALDLLERKWIFIKSISAGKVGHYPFK